MGILQRLMGRQEQAPPPGVAVVGQGPEAGLLAAACEVCNEVELVGAEVVSAGDGSIRCPEVVTPSLDALDEIIRTPGLSAVEIVAPPSERASAARACIRAGLFTSLDPPPSISEIDELEELARSYGVPLRFRLLPLYYPPYRELKRLVDEEALSRPISLKLMTRRGQGTAIPQDFDPVRWLMENELGFTALASWLMGPIDKVHARLQSGGNGSPPSSLISWKYKGRHQFGFMQIDFCPGLHVRTFTEPVHRAIELTCIGGVIFATRGEGQMLRLPALMVRGKSTTTSFEIVQDDWREVYKNLAREMAAVVAGKKDPAGSVRLTRLAAGLVDAARQSAEKGDEVGF